MRCLEINYINTSDNVKMSIKIPFNIGFNENIQSRTGEIHLSFTEEFQAMEQEQRVKIYRAYLEHLIAKAQMAKDENSQKGVITVLQIADQLFPHLQAEQIPLQETIIVEMGENAEGSSLDDLLNSGPE